MNQPNLTRLCYLHQYPQPIPFLTAWQWQQELVTARRQDPTLADALILLEHPPVYTFGRGADLEFAKFCLTDRRIEWHRIERGGEVTHHAPGQIVAYPILNLNFYQQDLHWYLRQLEQVLIEVLAEFDIDGDRLPGLTGVWVQGEKIAQIGIKVSRWITMHGFALNVNLDLAGFQQIVPCGISNRTCCSMAQFIPGIEIETVREAIARCFAQVFQVNLQEVNTNFDIT
jgi:lipoyl(octanoyl) transferase